MSTNSNELQVGNIQCLHAHPPTHHASLIINTNNSEDILRLSLERVSGILASSQEELINMSSPEELINTSSSEEIPEYNMRIISLLEMHMAFDILIKNLLEHQQTDIKSYIEAFCEKVYIWTTEYSVVSMEDDNDLMTNTCAFCKVLLNSTPDILEQMRIAIAGALIRVSNMREQSPKYVSEHPFTRMRTRENSPERKQTMPDTLMTYLAANPIVLCTLCIANKDMQQETVPSMRQYVPLCPACDLEDTRVDNIINLHGALKILRTTIQNFEKHIANIKANSDENTVNILREVYSSPIHKYVLEFAAEY